MSDIEVFDTLMAILRLQTSVIDELFRLLAMHISSQELNSLSVIDKINEAAKLKTDLDRRCV